MSRVRITVRGGRGSNGRIGSRGQDIGVYAEIDGKRAILPVTGLVLRADGRRAIVTVNLMVDEVDITDVERVDAIDIVPRLVDKNPDQHECPACKRMTRNTTAGCDYCDLEDK